MAFLELRQYHVRSGKMAEWISLMDRQIIPFVISKGMVVNASFCAEQNDSTYIWIRRFASEAIREQQYEAVYESDHWREVLSPKVGQLLDREKTAIKRLTPTSLSPMQ